ncbi:hypothetical protein BTUL_0058g00560 [Botrytis tulipae]|uniref:Uncharacterized protein n=1 Tax=Botrytis tulipae TaxID=87230 RepID=A0A4Z1ERL7_9HELO|nr:hypothetical protein BTUL_0058g00560 [Botrytis tulipae]
MIEVQIARPAQLKLSDDEETLETSVPVTIPNMSKATDFNDPVDHGYPTLHSLLKQFTWKIVHEKIPYLGGPEIISTTGIIHGFSRVLEAFTEGYDFVREKQGLLRKQFTYKHVMQLAESRWLQIVPVRIDAEGIVPSALESV